jgi:uncharacterized protein YndB with AHSA1/START domain
MSADPLVVRFDVAAAPPRAFELWTQRAATWWPRAHTLSGDPAAITFEPRPQGRILERAPDGREHPWGTVLEWEPPRRLRYLWHLFFDPSEATEVEVRFEPRPGGTTIELIQTGWERLGSAGPPRRERTGQVWQAIADAFSAAAD